MPERRSGSARRGGIGSALALLVMCVAGVGCDGYADIRERLNEAERARFDRGMGAAVPCWSCHDITGTALKVGPPLRGFMNRAAGTASPYTYSAALANSGVVWTSTNLDAFLASPAHFIPGNRMSSQGITDPGTRSDLIFFLRLATEPNANERSPSR